MATITPSPELCAIVERWLRAYSSGDKTTVLNLMSDDPARVYVGSSDDEHWVGEELRQTFPHYIDDIPQFEWETHDARAYVCGEIGWVDWHATTIAPGTTRQVLFRSTFVFALENGVWKIVLTHNSNPVSNAQTLGYEARGFEELLAAAREGAALEQTGIATIMFTDIADSTAMAEALGDARWSGLVGAHVEAVTRGIETHQGRLIKTLGDGTMSSFASARAGLQAAQDLQRAMAAATGEPRLQIRIGLHTGDLIQQEGDVVGTVVNKAARIAALAAPGEIRASDATRIMVGAGDFAFSDPVTVPLKGLEGDHVIHRLEWQA